MPRMVSSFGRGSFSFPSFGAGGPLVIILTGTSLSGIGAQNAGATVGLFTVQSGVQTSPLVLGGPNAALFTTDNGGICPCHLIAAVNIPDGSYSITWSPG